MELRLSEGGDWRSTIKLRREWDDTQASHADRIAWSNGLQNRRTCSVCGQVDNDWSQPLPGPQQSSRFWRAGIWVVPAGCAGYTPGCAVRGPIH
jgi:hypothetical protein